MSNATFQNVLVRSLSGGLFISLALLAPMARAAEGGGSVYPLGVETVYTGIAPPAGVTNFLLFNTAYTADESVNSAGQSSVKDYHVRIGVICPKVVHNWGLHLLGGTLFSTAALPIQYKGVWLPTGKGDKIGFSNPSIGVAELAYHKGSLNWWYGYILYLPGFVYHRTDLLNTGQHNFAQAPQGAISWLPAHGRTELSTKFQLIFNDTDPATHYRSGDEAVWEYDGMQRIFKGLFLGGNGYYYQQVTADQKNGSMYADGHYGRNVAYGPQVRYRLGKCNLTAKYLKDSLTENRAKGNAFWFQLGLPIGGPRG